MAKKDYPCGFRLTKKTAQTLAIRELGTAKGLEQEPGMPEGFFHVVSGSLKMRICPDASGCIRVAVHMSYTTGGIHQFYDRDTLLRNFEEEEAQRRKERREALESWVYDAGAEQCHKLIDKIWNGEKWP